MFCFLLLLRCLLASLGSFPYSFACYRCWTGLKGIPPKVRSWQVFLDARYVGVSYVVTPYLYWSTHTSAEDEEEDDDDG